MDTDKTTIKHENSTQKPPVTVAIKSNDDKKKIYEPWTPEDDTELIRLWNEGFSVHDIAKIFGKRDNAIRVRLGKIGG